MTPVLSALDAKRAFPLRERRSGDQQVWGTHPDATSARGHRPVFVDDIVASGHTIDTATNLEQLGLPDAGPERLSKPMAVALIALFELGSLPEN